MSDFKLSVVVPAYNVGNTLHRCVESVLMQGGGIEIIIVDDGSYDNTATVADALGDTYNNIKVIHQDNCGLSEARNRGVDAATADLITFVDSDDWLNADIYPALVKRMEECGDCDLLEFSLVRHNGRKEYSPLVLGNETYHNSRDYWFKAKAYRHAYAWNKIFRRRVFFGDNGDALRFRQGLAFEDIDFLAILLRRDLTIITTDTIGYVYSHNPRGITNTAALTEQSQLLNTNIRVMKALGIGFPAGNTPSLRLTSEEEEYYMSVVNIQIVECRLSGSKPRLPTCKLTIRAKDLRLPVLLMKKIILNAFGIGVLCRLFRWQNGGRQKQ